MLVWRIIIVGGGVVVIGEVDVVIIIQVDSGGLFSRGQSERVDFVFGYLFLFFILDKEVEGKASFRFLDFSEDPGWNFKSFHIH